MIGRVRTNRQGKISILINIFFTIGFKFKLKKGDPCGVSCAASSPRKNTFRSGGKKFSKFKYKKYKYEKLIMYEMKENIKIFQYLFTRFIYLHLLCN